MIVRKLSVSVLLMCAVGTYQHAEKVYAQTSRGKGPLADGLPVVIDNDANAGAKKKAPSLLPLLKKKPASTSLRPLPRIPVLPIAPPLPKKKSVSVSAIRPLPQLPTLPIAPPLPEKEPATTSPLRPLPQVPALPIPPPLPKKK